MSGRRAQHSLNQSPLYKLRSRSKLAALLKVTNAQLRELAAGDTLYREFDIPKKGGGNRHVENPCRALKVVQARLARLLSRVVPPHYLYCPVKGRSYVFNAARHAGNRVVRSVDVRKYFPNTRSRRVFWFFHKVMKCERDVAGLLTALSVYSEHLPTGSPLSPIMAFFAHYDLWEAVAAYCDHRGLTLTVYVDDCTVSGPRVTAGDMWEIKKLIHGSGLRYHKEKAYFDRPAEVTGVILKGGRPVLPNRQHLKLRNAKRELAVLPGDQALIRQILGLRAQAQQISKTLLAPLETDPPSTP